MSIVVTVNRNKIPPAEAIRWCQDHMPNSWSRHSVPSSDYEGMYEFSKEAYSFETVEDALLFKLHFPGSKLITRDAGPGWYYTTDNHIHALLRIKY